MPAFLEKTETGTSWRAGPERLGEKGPMDKIILTEMEWDEALQIKVRLEAILLH